MKKQKVEEVKPVEKITAGELCEDYQIKLAELMELASGLNIIIILLKPPFTKRMKVNYEKN